MPNPLTKRERRDDMLRAAIHLSQQPGGWFTLTRRRIARCVGCSEGLVSFYLGDTNAIRKAVLKRAEKLQLQEILVQANICNDTDQILAIQRTNRK